MNWETVCCHHPSSSLTSLEPKSVLHNGKIVWRLECKNCHLGTAYYDTLTEAKIAASDGMLFDFLNNERD